MPITQMPDRSSPQRSMDCLAISYDGSEKKISQMVITSLAPELFVSQSFQSLKTVYLVGLDLKCQLCVVFFFTSY